jgi:CRP-like cAMP-binding protein
MASAAKLQQLKLTHFLRGLDEPTLEKLASDLQSRQFEPGQLILAQGDYVSGLTMLLNGRVEVVTTGSRGERQALAEEEAGALLGAEALLQGRPAGASLVAIESSLALYWDKKTLFPFLESHPSALESLQLAAASQTLARARDLNWLAEDEGVFALGRRHISRLFFRMIGPVLVLSIGGSLAWFGLSGESALLLGLAAGVLGLAILFGIWQWLDWENDFFVVTDQRVIWLEKVIAIYDSRVEAPLHQVLAVSVESDVLGRWLGYGKVITKTFTGQIVFEHVGRPRSVAAVIEERWRRHQLQDQRVDREDKLAAVRQILHGRAEKPTIPPPVTAPEPSESEESAGSSEIGLNHWNLDLRFEEKGVIVYRKHWAVLLGAVTLPSLALLLLVGAAGAHMSGLLPGLGSSSFWAGVILGSVLLVAWWLYQFADWANDIYQVSPTHILDVYRRPLGRELRRAAPLENILSTEVDRRGLIGLLLDFGDVRVNIGAEQLDFEGVFHPGAVQQDIVRAQEVFLAKKREGDRQQRREEMVEWLGAYHDQITTEKQKPPDDPEYDVYP